MNQLTQQEYDERFGGHTESAQTTLLVIEINSHRSEIARLKAMIKNFCDSQSHAVDMWREQKHIKPLFEESGK